ncbi:hypothetical protein IAU59_005016 [Kwoniella sp. CBS 9459]
MLSSPDLLRSRTPVEQPKLQPLRGPSRSSKRTLSLFRDLLSVLSIPLSPPSLSSIPPLLILQVIERITSTRISLPEPVSSYVIVPSSGHGHDNRNGDGDATSSCSSKGNEEEESESERERELVLLKILIGYLGDDLLGMDLSVVDPSKVVRGQGEREMEVLVMALVVLAKRYGIVVHPDPDRNPQRGECSTTSYEDDTRSEADSSLDSNDIAHRQARLSSSRPEQYNWQNGVLDTFDHIKADSSGGVIDEDEDEDPEDDETLVLPEPIQPDITLTSPTMSMPHDRKTKTTSSATMAINRGLVAGQNMDVDVFTETYIARSVGQGTATFETRDDLPASWRDNDDALNPMSPSNCMVPTQQALPAYLEHEHSTPRSGYSASSSRHADHRHSHKTVLQCMLDEFGLDLRPD